MKSFRLQNIAIPLQATGGVDRTPRRTHMFPVLICLSSASHCLFLLTHARVWLKSQLGSSDAVWNQDTTTRCSAVGRTVWSSGQHHAIHSKGKSASVERKQGEYYQWKAKGMCTKGDACSFRHDESRGEKFTRSSSPTTKTQTANDVINSLKGSAIRCCHYITAESKRPRHRCGHLRPFQPCPGFVNQHRVHLLMKDLCRAVNSCKPGLIVDALRIACNGLSVHDCQIPHRRRRFWLHLGMP